MHERIQKKSVLQCVGKSKRKLYKRKFPHRKDKENDSQFFIGCKNDEQVKPLGSKLPQMDGYVNSFKEAKQKYSQLAG